MADDFGFCGGWGALVKKKDSAIGFLEQVTSKNIARLRQISFVKCPKLYFNKISIGMKWRMIHKYTGENPCCKMEIFVL
jgi:hypothetical protein